MSLNGQARKSLWIETPMSAGKAGSDKGQARKSLWIETDLLFLMRHCRRHGQARKSLWIETFICKYVPGASKGQARKSLWIETWKEDKDEPEDRVRLVRACGSKPSTSERRYMPHWVRLVRACGSKHSPSG